MATFPPITPLSVEGLAFAVDGKQLLSEISFTLEAHRTALVLGPNGAGKSLLLRLCHGLLQPTAGRVSWQGAGADQASAHQAMVFQRPVMLRRSAAANIDYALSLRGVPARQRSSLTAEALERAGLSALAKRPARVLSGGEQQRLALARAWSVRPQVLFLDEPTASLDPAATRAVEELIGRIRADGTTIVMTTHDLGQARRLADEIIFLHRGRLVEKTAAADFFSNPQSQEARAFVAGELLW
ncbi:MAG: ATP-binding cassette domain-containing protein [Rhodospirillales bacterium]|nr:ATP-binding cassette domain-containing protein [Rhodospirillales bacterium]